MSWTITPEQKTDPDALAYLAEVERIDGQALEVGVRAAVIDFVTGCKADGIWNAIKASCILAGARTLNGALVPLVGAAPTPFNFLAADYSRRTGLKGNAVDKRLDTNRLEGADPQNNAHHSVYVTTPPSPYQTGAYIGTLVTSSTSSTSEIVTINDGRIIGRSRKGSNNGAIAAPAAAASGLIGVSRNNAASYTIRVASGLYNITDTSAAPQNTTYNVFCRSDSTIFSSARLAFYSIGESLDLALLDARVTTLINAFAAAIP